MEGFSGVGSSLLESSLLHTFGPGCLKLGALGYDAIYERAAPDIHTSTAAEDNEVVSVHGALSQR